jgi:hypothetical protein
LVSVNFQFAVDVQRIVQLGDVWVVNFMLLLLLL